MATPILDYQATSTAYDQKGLERCDALFANPLNQERGPWRQDFTNDALSSMDRAILGMRFKEWKPLTDFRQQHPDRTYCYLHNSNAQVPTPNANIQDPFLTTLKCSPDDLQRLGGQSTQDFITNIFPDQNPDHPHARRFDYDKCVFEIDPTKVTAPKLAKFWEALSDAECAGYKATAQAQITDLQRVISQCNAELQRTKTTLSTAQASFSNLQSYHAQFTTCQATSNALNTQLATLANAQSNLDCRFYGGRDFSQDIRIRTNPALCGQIQGEKQSLDAALNTANQALSASNAQRSKLTRDARTLESANAMLQSRSNALTNEIRDTTESYAACSNVDVPRIKARADKLAQDLQQAIKSITQSNTQLQTITNTNAALTNQLNALTQRQNALARDLPQTTDKYIACVADTNQQRTLWQQREQDAIRYERLLQECQTDTQIQTRRLDQLNKTVDALTRERDDWIARCRQSQQDFYTRSIAKIGNEAKTIEARGREICGASDPIAREVQDLNTRKLDEMRKLEDMRTKPLELNQQWCRTNETEAEKCCKEITTQKEPED